MGFEQMTVEELNARKAEIAAMTDEPGADLDALTEEVRGINIALDARRAEQAKAEAEAEEKRAEEARKAEQRAAVACGAGEILKNFKTDEVKKMSNEEIRGSAEYMDAFAKYIRTGDDAECRSLLTVTASGTVPVPQIVDNIIHTAWENEEILSRCTRTNIRGILKVAFENTVDPAYLHTEGTSAPTEESLALGIVTMTPATIKKWITLSTEAEAMGSDTLVNYVYRELAYQITKKLAGDVVNDIATLSTSNGSTAPGAKKVTAAPGLTTIATAFANLSDEAANPVAVMNKLTYANFVSAQAAGNFAYDPFMGLPVLFSSKLPAYDTASDNAVYAFVGDLRGEQINYPEGDGIAFKYDDLSLAEDDLVKIVGRQYVAHAAVRPFAFCNIAKPAAAVTT